MVIIGLLIGVVIKGHSLIENARIKSIINQANELTNAYYSYLDRYGKYPGDDITVANRWTGAGVGNNNGRIDVAEPFLANQHLALAGLIPGTYNGTDQAIEHRYNGSVFLVAATGATGITPPAGLSGICVNVINFIGLPAEAAQALDVALDDGNYNEGKVRSSEAYIPDTTISNTALCL